VLGGVRGAPAGTLDEVRHREKWRLALDMLDEVRTDWACRIGR
jgi:hypothetical protein